MEFFGVAQRLRSAPPTNHDTSDSLSGGLSSSPFFGR